MPAIQLARLRQQALDLSQYYLNPHRFTRELDHLFAFYADRTHRPNQSGAPPLMVFSYNVAQPVLYQIMGALTPLAKDDPQAALALADAFWAEEKYEFRILAAQLIGILTVGDWSPILGRILAWVEENEEDQILEALAAQSVASLRRDARQEFIAFIGVWLEGDNIKHIILALLALQQDLKSAKFEDLPVYFRILRPKVENPVKILLPYLINLIKPLARRSPQETAYFLRQGLENSQNNLTARLVRNCLGAFPEDLQAALQIAAKKA